MRAACRDDVKINVKNEVVSFTGSDDVAYVFRRGGRDREGKVKKRGGVCVYICPLS